MAEFGTDGGAAQRERILAAALEEAEAVGWHDLRLRHVAERLGLPLSTVQAEFRDADAIADTLFQQALQAMLAAEAQPGFAARPPSARTAAVLLRWFDALAPHRALAGEMIREKLWPSHPHHWVPMVFSLSRLIHWLREAALLDAGGLRRQAEEVGLTLVVLRSLPDGLSIRGADRGWLRIRLTRRLRWLDRLA
jgi:AcrR family transcriptional regulator